MAEEITEQALIEELMRRGLPMDVAQEMAAIATGNSDGDVVELDEDKGGNNA